MERQRRPTHNDVPIISLSLNVAFFNANIYEKYCISTNNLKDTSSCEVFCMINIVKFCMMKSLCYLFIINVSYELNTIHINC